MVQVVCRRASVANLPDTPLSPLAKPFATVSMIAWKPHRVASWSRSAMLPKGRAALCLVGSLKRDTETASGGFGKGITHLVLNPLSAPCLVRSRRKTSETQSLVFQHRFVKRSRHVFVKGVKAPAKAMCHRVEKITEPAHGTLKEGHRIPPCDTMSRWYTPSTTPLPHDFVSHG